jgi:dipeptidyl-peptidase 4
MGFLQVDFMCSRLQHLGPRIVLPFGLVLIGCLTPSNPGSGSRVRPAKDLTVSRIYSSPNLSGHLLFRMEWAPNGLRLGYFRETSRGRTQLMAVDAATGNSRTLISPGKLAELMPLEKAATVEGAGFGRAAVVGYLWSPDSRSVLLIGTSRLVLYTPGTGTVKHLLGGNTPLLDVKFSPDGKWLAYLRDYNVWAVNTSSGESRPLTTGGREDLRKGQVDWVYPEELNLGTAYWWSPDSQKIAYLEFNEHGVTKYPISSMEGKLQFSRYPQAGEHNPVVRVGVVSVNGGKTTWMDIGSDTNVYLPRVKWLPNSRQVAIERLNRTQNRLDLVLGNAATGASRVILADIDKHWINITDDLYFFSDSKRFLWSSERTGFRHLYLYNIEGHELEQLTSGNWEISDIPGFGPGSEHGMGVSESRGYVYFMCDKNSPIDLQLYRLSLADKSLARITQGAGTHFASISPNAAYFVDTFSTAMTPPTQTLYHADGARVAVLNDNKVPELADYDLSTVKFLTLKADDGTTLHAKMTLPRHFNPAQKYPVLVSVYGGPETQEVRNAWGGTDFLWSELMAEKGYIVWLLDNRGSYGRGHAFETPVYHQFGMVELEDQLAGVHYLKSLRYVDSARIGIWGWSYGGYMTIYSMLNAPDVFKAGVAVAPVTDWRLYDTIYTERYMGMPQQNSEGYKQSSDLAYADKLAGKLMLVHGTADDNVHFANTADMLNAFIAAGKYPACVMIFPGRGHQISDRPARIQLFERITQFFLSNL